MSIRFHSVGGAGEVTGSKHILSIDGARCLIDCGAFQGRRDEAEKSLVRVLPAMKSSTNSDNIPL